MIRAGDAFDALVAGLRGNAIAGAELGAVIALANHTLLTPALYSALVRSGEIDKLPQDAREYLGFIHECNRQRNLRLRSQLNEAVAALNRCGIAPLLIKGAVPLFLSAASQLPNRMTSDLDVCVEAAEEVRARTCLEQLGYVELVGDRGMERPQDVGPLELRARRRDVFQVPDPIRWDGLLVKIPSVQSRALHWILHDLIKEGDYWRGRIDLRHLHDLAELDQAEGVDWQALRAALPDQTARNALDTQLLALHRLFGVSMPGEWAMRPLVRFQHWRRVCTARHPVMGAPFRLAGNVAWGVRRLLQDGLTRRAPADLARSVVRNIFDLDLRTKV